MHPLSDLCGLVPLAIGGILFAISRLFDRTGRRLRLCVLRLTARRHPLDTHRKPSASVVCLFVRKKTVYIERGYGISAPLPVVDMGERRVNPVPAQLVDDGRSHCAENDLHFGASTAAAGASNHPASIQSA